MGSTQTKNKTRSHFVDKPVDESTSAKSCDRTDILSDRRVTSRLQMHAARYPCYLKNLCAARRQWLRGIHAVSGLTSTPDTLRVDTGLFQLLQFFRERPGLHRLVGGKITRYYSPPPAENVCWKCAPALKARVCMCRTLASSNYRHFYARVGTASFPHQLLFAVSNLLELVAARMNPTFDQNTIRKHVVKFMKAISNDVCKDMEINVDVDVAAEILWISGRKLQVIQNMELCRVFNAVIRDDIVEEIEAAATIFRSINSRVVRKGRYPANCETWRGGSFLPECRKFFELMIGKKYRIPGFLSTSDNKQVALNFARCVDKATRPCALWCIKLDRRSEFRIEYRPRYMSVITRAYIPGEDEYLFAPYSVFRLVSVKWSKDLSKPHEFVIKTSVDGKCEDEGLPLAPWY